MLRFDTLLLFEVEPLLLELRLELEVLFEPDLPFELLLPLPDWLAFIAEAFDKARAKSFTNWRSCCVSEARVAVLELLLPFELLLLLD